MRKRRSDRTYEDYILPNEDEQYKETKAKHELAEDRLPYFALYTLFCIVTAIYALFTTVGTGKAFHFLPRFMQAIQAALLGPAMKDENNIPLFFAEMLVLTGLSYYLPKVLMKRVSWRNDPDYLRKGVLFIILWAVVIFCCLPLPFSVPLIGDYIISPVLGFSHYASGTATAVFSVIYRLGLGLFSALRIAVLVCRLRAAGILMPKGIRQDYDASLKKPIAYFMTYWGIAFLTSTAYSFLFYLIMNSADSFFMILLKLATMLATGGLFFLAVLVGLYLVEFMCDKTHGEIGKAYPVLLIINALCFVIPLIIASVAYGGTIGCSLQDTNQALYGALYNFATSICVYDKLEMRPVVLICDLMLVYSAANLFALIYAWLIKCPYCGRYFARLTDKGIEKTLGSSAYTQITTQQKQVRIKREDGGYDTGATFSQAYNPAHRYEYTPFMHDLEGNREMEERQQDKVTKYFLMNHHTTCKYCGTSLKVRFKERSETSDVGGERVRTYADRL